MMYSMTRKSSPFSLLGREYRIYHLNPIQSRHLAESRLLCNLGKAYSTVGYTILLVYNSPQLSFAIYTFTFLSDIRTGTSAVFS